MKKVSYDTKLCLEIEGVDQDCYKDLLGFKKAIEDQVGRASKKTHYDQLDDWSQEIYAYVRKMLKKHGFVNGNPEANSKNPNASFWWKIYSLVSSIIYSPFLKTQVANHHSSAFERNEALGKEIEFLIEKLCDVEGV